MIWSAENRDMAGTQAAMMRATRKALDEAKLRGLDVPVWRDGKVVWVDPDAIELTRAEQWIPDRRFANSMEAGRMKPEDYFEQVICNYNVGDIEELLKSKSRRAGPLLACVVNGIEAMGGMIKGFRCGSRDRSVHFMTTFMGLCKDQAELIYKAVRCGIAHECVTASGVEFCLPNDSDDWTTVLCKNDSGSVLVNVRALAEEYVSAIDKVKHRIAILTYVPKADEKLKTVIAKARNGLCHCDATFEEEESSSVPSDFDSDGSSGNDT